MNGLEILSLYNISAQARFCIEAGGDIADQILDEFRVVIRSLGDKFLIRALEQSVDFTGSRPLGDRDEFLDGHGFEQVGVDREMRALIMCSIL